MFFIVQIFTLRHIQSAVHIHVHKLTPMGTPFHAMMITVVKIDLVSQVYIVCIFICYMFLQFQKHYPDIYTGRFPTSQSESDLFPNKPRIKPPLLARPLHKLRNLRLQEITWININVCSSCMIPFLQVHCNIFFMIQYYFQKQIL